MKVDHVQLEILETELFKLREKDIFQRIAAGYRRPSQTPSAPEKHATVHSSLLPGKAQPVKTQTVSQSLERAVECPLESPVKVTVREVDEYSEASTVDTIDAKQVTALEQAAEMLKASGLFAQAEELRRQAKAQSTA